MAINYYKNSGVVPVLHAVTGISNIILCRHYNPEEHVTSCSGSE